MEEGRAQKLVVPKQMPAQGVRAHIPGGEHQDQRNRAAEPQQERSSHALGFRREASQENVNGREQDDTDQEGAHARHRPERGARARRTRSLTKVPGEHTSDKECRPDLRQQPEGPQVLGTVVELQREQEIDGRDRCQVDQRVPGWRLDQRDGDEVDRQRDRHERVGQTRVTQRARRRTSCTVQSCTVRRSGHVAVQSSFWVF